MYIVSVVCHKFLHDFILSIECEGIIAHGIKFVSNCVQKIIIIIKAGFLVIIMYEKVINSTILVINRPDSDQLLSHGFHK